MKKRRIMFVCHGNICRSPMAEFIFRDMLKKKGILAEFTVASTATSSEEIYGGVGNPVYPPARAELAKHNIRCDGKAPTTKNSISSSAWTAQTSVICTLSSAVIQKTKFVS